MRYSNVGVYVFAGLKSPIFLVLYIMRHEFSHDKSIMHKIDAKNLDQHIWTLGENQILIT